MKLITPTILLLHWIGLFIYFTAVKFHPVAWGNYNWSVYYFSVNNLTICNYGLLFALAPRKKLGVYAGQFVLVDVIFTLTLGLATILDCKHIISNTYGFYISVLGMIITVIMILISGIRHGIFKISTNKNA